MNTDYGLFVLQEKKKELEKKIKKIQEGSFLNGKLKEKQEKYLYLFTEDLESINYTIQQLETPNKDVTIRNMLFQFELAKTLGLSNVENLSKEKLEKRIHEKIESYQSQIKCHETNERIAADTAGMTEEQKRLYFKSW